MQMKNMLKSQKGIMTVYVTVSVLTFLIIAASIFALSAATRKNQLKTLIKIKEVYAQDNSKKEEIYNKIKSQIYVEDGLVLHYDAINNTGNGHSNTATTWTDLSGNNNNGTLKNMSTTSTSSSWNSEYLSFDGKDDYITVPYAASIAPTNYTIELVLNREAIVNNNRSIVFVKWLGYTIEFNADNTISFGFNNKESYYKPSTTFNLNQTYHIAATYENNVQKLYVNGNLIGQNTTTNALTHTQTNLTIGNYNNSYFFKGKIYSIRMYNKALNADEISKNYNIDVQKYNI